MRSRSDLVSSLAPHATDPIMGLFFIFTLNFLSTFQMPFLISGTFALHGDRNRVLGIIKVVGLI